MEQTAEQLHIRLLDKLEIQYGSVFVDDVLRKSKKIRRLITYLILMRGVPVPVHKLYEALWDEMDIDNPESALKTLVSRARSMLATVDPILRNCIQAKIGAYGWNMDMTEDVDVFMMEALCKRLQKASALTDEFEVDLDQLLHLYTGELLPELSQENWVLVHAIRLEEEYKQSILHAVTLFHGAGEIERIVKTCRMALMRLPYEEELNAELIRALIALNRRNEAMNQYRHVTELHLKYMGAHPSSRIQDIYKEIIQSDTMLEKDMENISKELTVGEDAVGGAFLCEYAIFRDIFRLQLRSLERYQLACYLVMFKVGTMNGQALDVRVLDDVMRKLLTVLQRVLRKGDTITRYTAGQYAVLLPGPTKSTIIPIMNRIRLAFSQEMTSGNIVLEYRYTQLAKEED